MLVGTSAPLGGSVGGQRQQARDDCADESKSVRYHELSLVEREAGGNSMRPVSFAVKTATECAPRGHVRIVIRNRGNANAQ
jgi:hypothetical protein